MREKWLTKQPERYKTIEAQSTFNPFDKKHWIFTGLSFGILMFVLMAVVMPIIQSRTITIKGLGIQFVTWMIGGLVFGFTMKLYVQAKGKSAVTNENS